mmetsp:Transcript_41081/g.114277  ORF Transcript_41081/g.114277 Transcript_41081/m.114277 type:complete len:354 (-) Transcript_41081:1103-2164(-)
MPNTPHGLQSPFRLSAASAAKGLGRCSASGSACSPAPGSGCGQLAWRGTSGSASSNSSSMSSRASRWRGRASTSSSLSTSSAAASASVSTNRNQRSTSTVSCTGCRQRWQVSATCALAVRCNQVCGAAALGRRISPCRDQPSGGHSRAGASGAAASARRCNDAAGHSPCRLAPSWAKAARSSFSGAKARDFMARSLGGRKSSDASFDPRVDLALPPRVAEQAAPALRGGGAKRGRNRPGRRSAGGAGRAPGAGQGPGCGGHTPRHDRHRLGPGGRPRRHSAGQAGWPRGRRRAVAPDERPCGDLPDRSRRHRAGAGGHRARRRAGAFSRTDRRRHRGLFAGRRALRLRRQRQG